MDKLDMIIKLNNQKTFDEYFFHFLKKKRVIKTKDYHFLVYVTLPQEQEANGCQMCQQFRNLYQVLATVYNEKLKKNHKTKV
jgi:hypothetical protein